ncbi:uncharacterized protein LOC143291489 isoform X2 [Babylonia areolata]|uniref:uncharacterized protein LOC143291489 isoform X2 n=1 Tax=Babylonia areolata TaxID=304850 RepID=UPI003FD625F0
MGMDWVYTSCRREEAWPDLQHNYLGPPAGRMLTVGPVIPPCCDAVGLAKPSVRNNAEGGAWTRGFETAPPPPVPDSCPGTDDLAHTESLCLTVSDGEEWPQQSLGAGAYLCGEGLLDRNGNCHTDGEGQRQSDAKLSCEGTQPAAERISSGPSHQDRSGATPGSRVQRGTSTVPSDLQCCPEQQTSLEWLRQQHQNWNAQPSLAGVFVEQPFLPGARPLFSSVQPMVLEPLGCQFQSPIPGQPGQHGQPGQPVRPRRHVCPYFIELRSVQGPRAEGGVAGCGASSQMGGCQGAMYGPGSTVEPSYQEGVIEVVLTARDEGGCGGWDVSSRPSAVAQEEKFLQTGIGSPSGFFPQNPPPYLESTSHSWIWSDRTPPGTQPQQRDLLPAVIRHPGSTLGVCHPGCPYCMAQRHPACYATPPTCECLTYFLQRLSEQGQALERQRYRGAATPTAPFDYRQLPIQPDPVSKTSGAKGTTPGNRQEAREVLMSYPTCHPPTTVSCAVGGRDQVADVADATTQWGKLEAPQCVDNSQEPDWSMLVQDGSVINCEQGAFVEADSGERAKTNTTGPVTYPCRQAVTDKDVCRMCNACISGAGLSMDQTINVVTAGYNCRGVREGEEAAKREQKSEKVCQFVENESERRYRGNEGPKSRGEEEPTTNTTTTTDTTVKSPQLRDDIRARSVSPTPQPSSAPTVVDVNVHVQSTFNMEEAVSDVKQHLMKYLKQVRQLHQQWLDLQTSEMVCGVEKLVEVDKLSQMVAQHRGSQRQPFPCTCSGQGSGDQRSASTRRQAAQTQTAGGGRAGGTSVGAVGQSRPEQAAPEQEGVTRIVAWTTGSGVAREDCSDEDLPVCRSLAILRDY